MFLRILPTFVCVISTQCRFVQTWRFILPVVLVFYFDIFLSWCLHVFYYLLCTCPRWQIKMFNQSINHYLCINFLTRYSVNIGRHEFDIHRWYSTVNVNLASICKCKINCRLWRDSFGITSLPDVTVCDNHVRNTQMAETYVNDQYPPMTFLVTEWDIIFIGRVAFTTYQTCSLYCAAMTSKCFPFW